MYWPRWGVMSVTLSKLSLRNAKRQARDYLVYFVTVVMAAALLYSFNALVFSQEIRTLSKGMEMLPIMIAMADVVVVCVFGWLVAYATKFMLLRRGRELGTYLLIGLENKQVARLFFLENLAVGGCALVLGTALGGLLYQAFRAMALALFRLPYHFAFGFSLPALALTAVCFALIYLHALRRSRKYIRRAKIRSLIDSDRLNEGVVIQTGKKRRWVFGASILLGVVGTCLMMARSSLLGIIGAGCLILFLFGFFLSFASGVPAFFERKPARKYRGQNLLVFRTLTAKLATMGVLMATISMIFTATLISEGSGLMFRGLFLGRAAESACFDLYIGMEGTDRDYSLYQDYIQENIPVEQSVSYPVYLSGSSTLLDYITSRTAYYYFNFDQDPVLRYSDYTALRSIAGYPPVELGPGQYLLHCMTYLEGSLKAYKEPLTLGGAALQPGGLYTEPLSQGSENGRGYILVVPDEAVEGLPIHHSAYAAKTAEPVPYEDYYNLTAVMDKIWEGTGFGDQINTRAQAEAEVASQTALCVFPLYYLALSLTMTAATILTIQQLSETKRYRQQFALLQKLGMGRREMSKALRTQFVIYYALPAVPPVLIGAPFLWNLAHIPEPGVMVGTSSPAAVVSAALVVFFLMYAIYILLAYASLKRSVLPETA
ncbi:MAG: FtsX-like permease family protein [Lawsonibacter sp.]|nr:FtsX-like permease family protein [Lawsonibacter sp.]